MADNDTLMRALPDDWRTLQWVESQSNQLQAAACVRYALAFNQLDISWLLGHLHPDVTYASQSVFEKLVGIEAVACYLEGKFNTLRRDRDTQPRFELALTKSGTPCIAGFQAQGPLDRHWLDVPLITVIVETDAVGRINQILIQTIVPSPAATDRTGIFPGIAEKLSAPTPLQIWQGAEFEALRIEFFLLDGKISLDQRMKSTAEAIAPLFPDAHHQILIYQQLRGDQIDSVGRAQITGFPAVAVYLHGERIFRQQGLIGAQTLERAIRSAVEQLQAQAGPDF